MAEGNAFPLPLPFFWEGVPVRPGQVIGLFEGGPPPPPVGTLTVSLLCAYNHRLKLLLSGTVGPSSGTLLLADIITAAKIGGPLRVLLKELQAGAPFGTWLAAFDDLKLQARVTNESVAGYVTVEPVASGLSIALTSTGDAVLELIFNHSLAA